ncbi:MAG: penicillin-binding protein activator [Rhodobacteraceae bacterium]|nr:penicillin-binding protein activator [Paracoccaceae bacterium]
MIDGFVHLRKSMRTVMVVLGTLFALTACNVDTSSSFSGPKIDAGKPVPVALLIPKGYENSASLADSLEKAALMAVADLQNVTIDLRVYDTAGSAAVAAQVAQKAVDVGLAVADAGVNVLSFSNNTSIAGGNLFVLGQTFENTAKRLVEFAAAQGKRRAVIVYPSNTEGEIAKIALENAAEKTELTIVHTQSFQFTREAVANAVPLVRAAVEIEEADLVILTSTTAGALGLLVQMLPEAGVDPQKVQYAGLARWDIPAQTLELPGVQDGWFAVPDRDLFTNFSERYEEQYETKPHQLASLAYDGVAAVGALVASGNSNALTGEALTQSAGFEGVNGIFRFLKNGTNERGLSIAQVVDKQVVIIDPAPKTFGFSGF